MPASHPQIPGSPQFDARRQNAAAGSKVETWLLNKIINHYADKMKGSWTTKLAGGLSLITLIGNAAIMIFDGNPATNPDWSIFFPAIVTAWGVVTARQNTVSSQDVGIRQ